MDEKKTGIVSNIILRSETLYYAEHYLVYEQTPCPQQHVTCCVDYFFVLGHCLRKKFDKLLSLNLSFF